MSTDEKPYIEREVTMTLREYNPKFGDERVCQCGHVYYRHFDSYAGMDDVGCKYCECGTFVEVAPTTEDRT